jgi:hypothetical protein
VLGGNRQKGITVIFHQKLVPFSPNDMLLITLTKCKVNLAIIRTDTGFWDF